MALASSVAPDSFWLSWHPITSVIRSEQLVQRSARSGGTSDQKGVDVTTNQTTPSCGDAFGDNQNSVASLGTRALSFARRLFRQVVSFALSSAVSGAKLRSMREADFLLLCGAGSSTELTKIIGNTSF